MRGAERKQGKMSSSAGATPGDGSVPSQSRPKLSKSMLEAKARHEALLRQLELRSKARAIPVPTDDKEVRYRLRCLGEPITLFGEQAIDRRHRLRTLYSELAMNGKLDEILKAFEKKDEVKDEYAERLRREAEQQPYFEEGPDEVRLFRAKLVNDSLVRARQRSLREAQRNKELGLNEDIIQKRPLRFLSGDNSDQLNSSTATGAKRREYADQFARDVQRMRHVVNSSSQIGDVRTLSSLAFSPVGSGSYLVTGSWSGNSTVWDPLTAKSLAVLKGHHDRVTDVVFDPTYSENPEACHQTVIATSGADGRICLWPHPALRDSLNIRKNDGMGIKSEFVTMGLHDYDVPDNLTEHSQNTEYLSEEDRIQAEAKAAILATQALIPSIRPIARLTGHRDRLSRLAYHPSGTVLLSSSFDRTFRVWDLETNKCVLAQEGHLTPVYGIAVHPDGALVATGDLGAVGRLWDLRTGRALLALEGHSRQILACDFADDGRRLATAGGDNTIRIWDLRARDCLYTIPAHTALVSDVKFKPNDSRFLISSSYDGTAAIWSGLSYTRIATLLGHNSHVTRASFAPDGSCIATAGADRRWKLWNFEGDVEQGQEEEMELMESRRKLEEEADMEERLRHERNEREKAERLARRQQRLDQGEEDEDYEGKGEEEAEPNYNLYEEHGSAEGGSL